MLHISPAAMHSVAKPDNAMRSADSCPQGPRRPRCFCPFGTTKIKRRRLCPLWAYIACPLPFSFLRSKTQRDAKATYRAREGGMHTRFGATWSMCNSDARLPYASLPTEYLHESSGFTHSSLSVHSTAPRTLRGQRYTCRDPAWRCDLALPARGIVL